MKNITTQHTRAEDIKGKKFDFAVSRAVAPLKDLWRWSKPLLLGEKSEVESQKSGARSRQLSAGSNGLDKVNQSGLICLKGGDLKQEILESGVRPRKMQISEMFEEEFFREKYLLYVPS